MIAKMTQTLADLYEVDETAWLDAMAELIAEGRLHDLDYAHFKEFLEDMARRDRREVRNRLMTLMTHVLKWIYQKKMRTPSWRSTIRNQRRKLENDLLTSGTLRNHAESILAESYAKALEDAVDETGLTAETFPAECPWTLEQLLAPDILKDEQQIDP